MPTIVIPLDDLILDPETGPESIATSDPDAGSVLALAYAFLGHEAVVTVEGGSLRITLPDPPAQQRVEQECAWVPGSVAQVQEATGDSVEGQV